MSKNFADDGLPDSLPDLKQINHLKMLLKQLNESARILQAQVENLQEVVEDCAVLALEEERQKLEEVTKEIARMNKHKLN